MWVVHPLLLVLAAAGVVLAVLLFLAALAISLRIAFLFPEAAPWASEFGEPYLYPLTDPPLVQLAQLRFPGRRKSLTTTRCRWRWPSAVWRWLS